MQRPRQKGYEMKPSISKELFIEQFDCYLRVMTGFVKENKTDLFYSAQRDYNALLSFAFINDLLSDEEYQHYKPYEFCQFGDFSKLK